MTWLTNGILLVKVDKSNTLTYHLILSLQSNRKYYIDLFLKIKLN